MASPISLAVTGVFTYYLARRITAPLRAMNRVAHQIAKGQFDERVIITTQDELGELGATFNHMAQELAVLEQMRREFVANVSHDLRSPLPPPPPAPTTNSWVSVMLAPSPCGRNRAPA